MANREFPQYQFVKPRSWTAGRAPGEPSVIFIHTTEGSEGRRSAEDGASYDQRRTDGTSTHFFVDSDSVIQCVYTWDRAHAARSHGNAVGIQIEVCGRAGQTTAQWADAASLPTIENVARLCVALRKKYGKARFPLINLTPAQLRAGKHGFAEHYDATRAWPQDHGTHNDPGPNFPWKRLFTLIETMEKVANMAESENDPRSWNDPTVLAINFWWSEVYRAAQGKANDKDSATDRNARNAWIYVRETIGKASEPLG